MRGHHRREIAYELRCAIITCRIHYGATYDDIERKTGVARDTARKIATREIERAGCEDIHEVLACVGDLDRSGRIPRVADGTELSKTIRNTILDNPKLKQHEAVIDKENIVIPGLPEGKRHARSIIENVQHHHTHESDGHEFTDIVRINEISKRFLNEISKAKRKRFCEWALNRINNHNDIFICSDESWHEVGGPLHKKGRISVKEVMSMLYMKILQSSVLCSGEL